MLVNQESLLYSILKDGVVQNTVLKTDADALGYIDLDEYCRIQLVAFTNNFNVKLHKILIGDQQSFVISTSHEFDMAKNAIIELLKGKVSDDLIKSLLDSLAAVLKQALLDLQQEEYIAKLMKDFAK